MKAKRVKLGILLLSLIAISNAARAGKTRPPLALVKLLKVLDCHPDLLSEIRTA